jgi:hypothetical protein
MSFIVSNNDLLLSLACFKIYYWFPRLCFFKQNKKVEKKKKKKARRSTMVLSHFLWLSSMAWRRTLFGFLYLRFRSRSFIKLQTQTCFSPWLSQLRLCTLSAGYCQPTTENQAPRNICYLQMLDAGYPHQFAFFFLLFFVVVDVY